uniref:Uncharacterized protein n=1 Tax=Salmonella phage vB_SEnST11_KE22 TaxID=3161173 RepID=A0AAU8GHT8_9CAUD
MGDLRHNKELNNKDLKNKRSFIKDLIYVFVSV